MPVNDVKVKESELIQVVKITLNINIEILTRKTYIFGIEAIKKKQNKNLILNSLSKVTGNTNYLPSITEALKRMTKKRRYYSFFLLYIIKDN